MKTNQGAREIQVQVDGEEALDPDNTSSVLSIILYTINNEFKHECLHEAIWLLSTHPIHQSTYDHVPGNKYSIPALPGTMFLVHQACPIWFIVRK